MESTNDAIQGDIREQLPCSLYDLLNCRMPAADNNHQPPVFHVDNQGLLHGPPQDEKLPWKRPGADCDWSNGAAVS